MSNIRDTIGAYMRDDIDNDEAEDKLVKELTAEQMAEFIVSAYDRGWISPFNLGLTPEGYPI